MSAGFQYSYATMRRRVRAQVNADMEFICGSSSSDEFESIPMNTSNETENIPCTVDNQMQSDDEEGLSEVFEPVCLQSNTENELAGEFDIDDLDNSGWSTGDSDDDDGSCCSDSDTSDSASIREQLVDWALKFGVSSVAVSALLKILKVHFPSLPADARTLLHTPRECVIKQLAGGEYCHLGLEKGIKSAITETTGLTACVELQFNFDGLPLFKSSGLCLWPILCLLKNVPYSHPFVVGLFCGKEKPLSAADFLKDLVTELSCLLSSGLYIDSNYYCVKIHSVVCDAPARAFIKGIASHSGYSACEKCSQVGEYVGKVIFPETNAPLRTDKTFSDMEDENHHKEPCSLTKLNVGCVSQFGLDYMHMVCLGVMRRLLLYWKGPVGPFTARLGSRAITELSQKLLCLIPFIPHEFARKPRTVAEVMRWKATEFRLFLLYLSPVVLSGTLPSVLYDHFMFLFAAVRILACPRLATVFSDYAGELLSVFVTETGRLYGREALVYNVHSLVHIASDVKVLGNLDEFSSFPFENALGQLKKLVRKPQFPIQQIVRRLEEKTQIRSRTSSHSSMPAAKYEHFNGPVLPGFHRVRQYKQLEARNCLITLSSKNNCILTTCGHVALVRNIVVTDGDEVWLMCEKFLSVTDYFTQPLLSTRLGICRVTCEMSELCSISLSSFDQKCLCIPCGQSDCENAFVIMPILHT